MHSRLLSQPRWIAFFVVCALVLATHTGLLPGLGSLLAQEAAPEAAAGAAGAGDKPNIVWHIIHSAGWFFGGILFALSMVLMSLSVMLAMDLRLAIAIPAEFVTQFTDMLNKGQLKEAFTLAKENNSFLAKVISAGMGRLQYGIEDARDAALNSVDSIRSSKEQLNNYIAVISSLGPLIGLVGTVYGMILSFMELAKPGARVEASKLADGISHALVITMLGIGLAVPGVFFNAFFRNRITSLSMDTSNMADDLLTQMYHNAKKPATANPASVSAKPAASQAVPVAKPTA